MIVELQERIVEYAASQLTAWIAADKSLVPAFADRPPILAAQPSHHFAEALTLRDYHEREGWMGFAHYAIGDQYLGSARRREGRRKLREIIGARLLESILALRATTAGTKYGAGEPDPFLFKPDGSFRFVEVKKGRDQLSPAQLTCIAQLLSVAHGCVDIVYARELRQRYSPRTYRFDLIRGVGERSA